MKNLIGNSTGDPGCRGSKGPRCKKGGGKGSGGWPAKTGNKSGGNRTNAPPGGKK